MQTPCTLDTRHLIHIEFRKQTNAYKKSWEFVGKADVTQAPSVGDTVNVHGHPYVVISRSWAYSTALADKTVPCVAPHCYLYLLDASPEDA